MKKDKKDSRTDLHVKITKSLKAQLKDFCRKRGVFMTDHVEGLISKSLKRN